VVQGSSTLVGDIPAGAPTVLVQGSDAGAGATLTSAAGFTNAGTITLQSTDRSWAASLTVASGTLTNAGTINVNAGTGGGRFLSFDLANSGTVNVNASASFTKSNGTYTNNAAITIAAGQTLTMSASGLVYKESGGTLTNNGSFLVSGTATFDFVS